MRHWIANRGWRGFLQEVWRRIRVWARGERQEGGGSEPGAGVAKHPFDVRYEVETGGLIWGEALGGSLDAPEDRDGRGRRDEVLGRDAAEYWVTGYYGVAPSVFSAAMERLALAWERTTFVDVGCGKGRALLLALRYPFHRVLGVELSPELARVAQRNVQEFRAAWRRPEVAAEVVTGDASAMELPPGALLLFLYHPFAAPVMTQFLARVRDAVRADRREVVLLYMNPELDGLLGRAAFLERMWDECFAMSEEDRAADRFGSAWERMVAYRVVPER